MTEPAMIKKRSNGCWTCRVRRKKCDECRPNCLACTSLAIKCHFEAEKPVWMDGGPRQKQMAEELKNQIKGSAPGRRERQAIASETGQIVDSGAGNESFVITNESDFQSGQGVLNPYSRREDAPFNYTSTTLAEALPQTPPISSSDAAMSDVTDSHLTGSETEGFHNPNYAGSGFDFPPMPIKDDLNKDIIFVSYYLDRVFPFLFPFYHPNIYTGRGWLFFALKMCRIVFHTAQGLGAYFLSMRMFNDLRYQQLKCKESIWKRVLEESAVTFESIQEEIVNLGMQEPSSAIKQKARLLGSIVHLLVFEVAVGRSGDWESHVGATIGLFEDIFQTVPLDSSQSGLLSVLIAIDKDLMIKYCLDDGLRIWTHDQEAFRFFAALLIFIDIIGSLTRRKVPVLMPYYPQTLAPEIECMAEKDCPLIRLSSVTGCRNWALVAIAKISELEAWVAEKKRNIQAGELGEGRHRYMTEFFKRTSDLHQEINERLIHLVSNADAEVPSQDYPAYYDMSPSFNTVTSTTITRIWAYAAQIYLAVVVVGWQPSNFEVSWGVGYVLQFLKKLKSPAHLRAVAWPLCIAGCLAENESVREEFRDLFKGIGGVELLGALGEAKSVMDEVWKIDDVATFKDWDIATCLNILGHPVLLI